jgi:hypothetical protein
MERERLDRRSNLRGRTVTLLLLVAGVLLTWTLLRAFGTESGPRFAPSRAPAGQEPVYRGTPTYEQELIG